MSEINENVKGFVFKREFSLGVSKLSREQKGALFEALIADMNGEDLPEMDTITDIVFSMLIPSIHAAQNTYDRRSDTSADNGRKGGRPTKNRAETEEEQENQEPNQEPNNLTEKPNKPNNLTAKPNNLTPPIEKNRIEGNRIESSNTVTPLPPFEGEVVSDEEQCTTPQPHPHHKQKCGREPTGSSKPELEAYIKAHAISDELQEALIAFNEMRTKIRKPLTGEALKLIFGQLRKLAPNDEAMQTQIVQQSVMNSWQGIFPLNVGQNQPRGRFNGLQSTQTLAEHNMQVIERVAERMRAQGMDV